MAIRVLRQHQVPFEPHLYTWEARGGTRASAQHLGVDEHTVIRHSGYPAWTSTP
jgi:hypothetical protein